MVVSVVQRDEIPSRCEYLHLRHLVYYGETARGGGSEGWGWGASNNRPSGVGANTFAVEAVMRAT